MRAVNTRRLKSIWFQAPRADEPIFHKQHLSWLTQGRLGIVRSYFEEVRFEGSVRASIIRRQSDLGRRSPRRRATRFHCDLYSGPLVARRGRQVCQQNRCSLPASVCTQRVAPSSGFRDILHTLLRDCPTMNRVAEGNWIGQRTWKSKVLI